MMAPPRTASLGARGCLHHCGEGDEGGNNKDDVSRCGESILLSWSMISKAEKAKPVVDSD